MILTWSRKKYLILKYNWSLIFVLLKHILDLADDLLNKLQEIYPFLCENKYDGETERYLKYLAPLCYNQAINVRIKID